MRSHAENDLWWKKRSLTDCKSHAGAQNINIWVQWGISGLVFLYKLQYIVGFRLVEMAISTNPKPRKYRNLYENTGSGHFNAFKP